MSDLTTCAGCGAPINDVADDDPSKKLPCPACGSITRNRRLIIETLHVNLSPFAYQLYAKDFYDAYKAYKNVVGGARFSPARLTLLAQAVELAGKSLHVHQGKRDADLRCIDHDLVKACDPAILAKYEIVLTKDEETDLGKMNVLYTAKAFEYFWFSLQPRRKRTGCHAPEAWGLSYALTGRKDLPDEGVVEGLLIKLLAPDLT
jgi:hypothetical protein